MRMPKPKSRAMPTLTPEELRRLRESLPDLITDQFETVGAAADRCDVIVGANAHQYAAPSIAEHAGIGCVTAVYAPVALPSPELAPPPTPGHAIDPARTTVEEQWRNTAKAWNERALDRINRNRGRLGMDPIDDVLDYVLTDHTWLAADAALAPVPATPGRQIFQTGTGDVTYDLLFPRVAAVLHHGGAGTTAAAARAGVPQVVTPMFGDEFYWASRIVDLRVGAATPHATMTEESLAGALREVLDSGVVDRARTLATQVSCDGAEVAARRLEAEYGGRKR